jgi:hypothetical protein
VPGASQAGTWPTKHSLLTTNYEPKSPSRRAGDRSDEKIVIVRGALQLFFFRRASQQITQKVARFRQINTDNQHTHHDALEFPDGQVVLLTHLRRAQHATVLQLPAKAGAPVRAEAEVLAEAR